MQDWEPFHTRRNTCGDDPWDYGSQNVPQYGYTGGETRPPLEGSATPPPEAPRRPDSRKRRRGISLLVFLPLVLVCVLVALQAVPAVMDSLEWSNRTPEEFTQLPEEDAFSGDDGFSVDVDPEEDEDADSEDIEQEAETQDEASNIELYTGSAGFSLDIRPSDGLEALSYQEIYAKVLPSVVTITVYGDVSGAYATGIVLSEDGFILTNQHVVSGQDYCQVTTYDDKTYSALLVGEDPNSDLAVLKIEANSLTPAEFGDSEALTVGDECFAIGNPLGITYRDTFTNGIISALNRNVGVNGYTMTLIQTTAALNSGNSGGPLINVYGQVIGVNNMKIMSSSITVEGLGFAIPSVTVQKITDALLTLGYVEHPVIGITCYSVTAGFDDVLVDGLYVASVSENADAYAQGLQVGDIITAVNGQSIASVGDVTALLQGKHVGDEITATVMHMDGTSENITFALSEQNDLN